MRLSVVTPSYNQGHFIEQTIESVFAQGWPDLDYHVVDGGSTDATTDILRRYEGRLHWTSEPDKGQGDAVNKGVARSTGEILGWINSDDTYAPGVFEKVMRTFAERPDINFIHGDCHVVDEQGRVLRTWSLGPFNYRQLVRTGWSYIIQPTVFMRRSLFEDVNGIDPSIRLALDYDLWLRMGEAVKPLYFREVMADWRFQADSKTCSQREVGMAESKVIRRRHLRGWSDQPWVWYYDARAALYLKLLEPLVIRWKPQ